MCSRWLLTLCMFCSFAYSLGPSELIEIDESTTAKQSVESVATLIPQNFENATNAARATLKCNYKCDPQEIKKAADKIVKSGYKVKIKGRNYGTGMKLRFHPNTSIPTIEVPPSGSPNINKDNSEAQLAIGRGLSLPDATEKSGTNSPTESSISLRDAKVSNGNESPSPSNGVNNTSSNAHAGGAAQTGYDSGEALLNESPLTRAQNEINSAIAAVPINFANAPLSPFVRNDAANAMINVARNSISMPRGSSDLESNPLYKKVIDDENGTNIDENLKSLVKKDLKSSDPKSNFSDIKDIALSPSFQQMAAQLIGLQNLSNFNLAALGAEILMEKDSTSQELLGINKTLGSPYEKTIAKFNLNNNTNSINIASGLSGVADYSVFAPEDWIEKSRYLSDPSKRMLRPDNFDMAKAGEGIKSLELLILDLKKYNSLDLLNAVTVPMSDVTVGWTKEARERILLYLARMKKVPAENTANIDIEKVIEFKNKALALQKELIDLKVMLQFYIKFQEFYADANNRAVWEELAPESYLQAKRSLALIRFSLAVNGLRKKNYDKFPDESLSYLIASSFSELNKEKIRKKRALDKENKEDSLRLATGKKGLGE